ncbi:DNA polymerase (mitochondrion) [Phanerochaete sordida]|uniref:Probable DNA polymerase n=1 Tax=Phanerochaete sordida TaxID=48140 RepID=A0A9N7KZ59_9APHY|nr:DNA polymerase [Phanerochaete sordida]
MFGRIDILGESYHTNAVKKIVFSYIIYEGQATGHLAFLEESKYESKPQVYNSLKLPTSMNIDAYGTVIATELNIKHEGLEVNKFIVVKDNYVFQINKSLDSKTNFVSILGASRISWVDTKINNDVFTREINRSTFYIKNGEIIIKQKVKNAKPFQPLAPQKELLPIDSFLTLDIETILVGKVHKPYLISGYCHSIGSFHEYLDAGVLFKDVEAQEFTSTYEEMLDNLGFYTRDMFHSFLSKLISIQSIKYVYAHNFSKFDGPLLLRHLISFVDSKVFLDLGYTGIVEPMIFNGKLMSIKLKIKIGKKTRIIIFKDSMLLLPNSLRTLCSTFKVSTVKTYFPFHFSPYDNQLKTLFYDGPIPEFEYWEGISFEEYNVFKSNFVNKNWVFGEEAIKYCNIDCKSLFDILVAFNELIYSHFQINIHTALTLPALAMKIFKTHFLPKDTLYQILGEVEEDIRQAYTGGAVDLYVPHNCNGAEELYVYDVNSLYPKIMANYPMPTGKPIAFEGNILEVNPEAYGFFYCNITTPDYLEHPILQRKVKTKDGFRTIAGLGSWTGWIHSDELHNTKHLGYKFKIIRGYLFEPKVIFNTYVDILYQIKNENSKGSPLYTIAKLLLNSLYGKFGMKPEHTVVEVLPTNSNVFTPDTAKNIELGAEKAIITDLIQIDEGHCILVRKNIPSGIHDEHNDVFYGLDVNIGVAATITAGGRLFMSPYKNREDFKLYYSDTDSIIINKQLSTEEVGNELGMWKLEHVISKFVGLAPKTYAMELTNSKFIAKIKGFNLNSTKFGIYDFYKLLIKNSSIDLNQEKFRTNILTGQISFEEVSYNLCVTNNKRKLNYILDSNSGREVFSSTSPLNYEDIVINDNIKSDKKK